MLCAFNNRPGIASMLFRRGARVDTVNIEGKTVVTLLDECNHMRDDGWHDFLKLVMQTELENVVGNLLLVNKSMAELVRAVNPINKMDGLITRARENKLSAQKIMNEWHKVAVDLQLDLVLKLVLQWDRESVDDAR